MSHRIKKEESELADLQRRYAKALSPSEKDRIQESIQDKLIKIYSLRMGVSQPNKKKRCLSGGESVFANDCMAVVVYVPPVNFLRPTLQGMAVVV